jgi:hypothetical protein
MGVEELVLIGKMIFQQIWGATPTMKEINIAFLFLQIPTLQRHVAQKLHREPPSMQIPPRAGHNPSRSPKSHLESAYALGGDRGLGIENGTIKGESIFLGSKCSL